MTHTLAPELGESKASPAMKLNLEPTKADREARASCAKKTTPPMHPPDATTEAGVPKDFRRLHSNEVVGRGDFVLDEHHGFEPWEGPGGFRANAFVKPIYRRLARRTTVAKKSP